MPPTPLLIVTGPPASGKTALARRLARDLHLPLISRDTFKEKLFDTLGWDDRQRSKELGAASYEILWLALEINLAAGVTTVVESNFRGDLPIKHFRALAAAYPFTAYQVNCVTDGPTLLQRHQARSHSGERHPGHVDDRNGEELRAELTRGRLDPLPLDGVLFELDTTDLAAIDYDGLLTRLRDVLTEAPAAPTAAGFAPRLTALDHLVLTVRDIAATCDWYRRNLGMGAITFAGGRTALTFGQQKINLHEVGHEFEPKAAHPTPGSADLCFLTTQPIAALMQHLAALGTPIEVPPSRRDGARGPLLSLYLRDPDHNLIEVSNQLALNDPPRN